MGGLQTSDPAYFCRPDPGSWNPAPESKSLLVLFFRKEQSLLLSYEKEAKRLLILALLYDACLVPQSAAWRKTLFINWVFPALCPVLEV
jgi:hypothetical protein